jgi:hypothetical protein
MLRPVRTVRATTKEEVDAALAAADQITVEGDDELLTYAVNKAAGDSENRITLDLEADGPPAAEQEVERVVIAARARPVPPLPKRRSPLPYLFGVVAALLVIGVAAVVSVRPHPEYLGEPPPTDFSGLAWPAVAIVAIVALFLIARQAISSGSNVTIQWKVTEKVSGKVVITKVRERAPRQRAA